MQKNLFFRMLTVTFGVSHRGVVSGIDIALPHLNLVFCSLRVFIFMQKIIEEKIC